MPPPSPLDDLAHAIQILADSGDPRGREVAEGLDRWLAGSDPLEIALGAALGARSARRQRGRDEALRRLVQRFPAASARAVAASVYRLLHEYETSAWPRDRAHHRPDGTAGDCWDVLVNGSLCEAYLRAVLAKLAD
jgi:hypothetical protein